VATITTVKSFMVHESVVIEIHDSLCLVHDKFEQHRDMLKGVAKIIWNNMFQP